MSTPSQRLYPSFRNSSESELSPCSHPQPPQQRCGSQAKEDTRQLKMTTLTQHDAHQLGMAHVNTPTSNLTSHRLSNGPLSMFAHGSSTYSNQLHPSPTTTTATTWQHHITTQRDTAHIDSTQG
ncbi:uncharacterized protein LACBIDRAFT_303500 [Laccaria bicolor S238N-H82]|uniref:Predicted protein n=1 Tax=Laccaria bicolor (strain S238N-H82 / ATCC MYA-4686) TaxID=486041 RepID=B0DJL3_LACBS|nr:uncharacterized protein LACBIDRAFT_303500 [Laccaria bicolor S238N-H82]EDR05139.1 predicted protein [Laccaria bicolor S238N-H82]|eukprot:XP_001884104.1 predicted protein [Laccaria bicolor S238N-H82]